MVVVAIIGILSAVALPNFKKYQAKSKTSEAKLQLASIYTAETAFNSDFDTFASCLQIMGYDPSGEAAQRYYATGILASFGTLLAYSNGGNACSDAAGATSTYNAGKPIVAGAGTVSSVTGGAMNSTSFTVYAEGSIMSAAGTDSWTINYSKKLMNLTVGY